MSRIGLALWLSAFAIALAIRPVPAAQLPLVHVADVRLSSKTARLDYQSLDAAKHLLFIAFLGDDSIIVFDTKHRRVIATIASVSRVHGILVVPERDRVYASATGTDEVVAIDESTFKIVGRTDGGIYPDGIAYDPGTKRLFVSDEHGNTDTVINATTMSTIAKIWLGAEVGNSQYDPASHHVFVSLHDGSLVEIDPVAMTVLRRTHLTGCESSHGLLIDAVRRRAFIACQDNAKLVVLDMRTMRQEFEGRVGNDPDVLALDPAAHRLYVAAESGTVAIFSDGREIAPIAMGVLAESAHTVAVDPLAGLVYFPLQSVSGHAALRIMAEGGALGKKTR